jgi:primary-amine oxidase
MCQRRRSPGDRFGPQRIRRDAAVDHGRAGLPRSTAANRPIADTELVAWLTPGFHHVPRPGDRPIMPVAWHSFEIRPGGFCARNSAIDLPRQP